MRGREVTCGGLGYHVWTARATTTTAVDVVVVVT